VVVAASIRLDGVLKRNAVIPDALFGLRFNDEEESYFMLVIDRGEMAVERYNNLHRTYFAKKMLTYYEANRQRRQVHSGNRDVSRRDGNDHTRTGREDPGSAADDNGRAGIEHVPLYGRAGAFCW
jgi:hypothetical protein